MIYFSFTHLFLIIINLLLSVSIPSQFMVWITDVDVFYGCKTWMSLTGEKDYPEYGILSEVLVLDDAKYFVLTVLETVLFWSRYMSYEVQPTSEKRVLVPNDLPWHGVLHLIKKGGKSFVIEKHSANIEELLDHQTPVPLYEIQL